MFLGACRCLWRCCWSLHGVQPVKRSWVYLLLYTQVWYLFKKSTSGWIILSPSFDTLLQDFRNTYWFPGSSSTFVASKKRNRKRSILETNPVSDPSSANIPSQELWIMDNWQFHCTCRNIVLLIHLFHNKVIFDESYMLDLWAEKLTICYNINR